MKLTSFCQACMDDYQSLLRCFLETGRLTPSTQNDKVEDRNPTLARLVRSMTTNHSTDAGIFDDASKMGELKDLARAFHKTCPGDWTSGQEVSFGGRLRGIYVDGEADHAVEMYSSIRFRLDLALFTDQLVAHFALPRPSEKSCLAWEWREWSTAQVTREREVADMLKKGGFGFQPTDGQGPPFDRPRWYVAACLVERDIEGKELEAMVSEICECVNDAKRLQGRGGR